MTFGKNTFEKYAEILEHEGLYSNGKRLSFYLKNYVFEDTQLERKSLIDIGSGRGIYSFFAGFAGAERVVCIEPEPKGSSKAVIDKFERLSKRFRLPQIELKKVRFQDFDPEDEKFDVILLHNSINHLDEEACINLKNSKKARRRYEAIFEKLDKISNSGTKLIIADCSRYNFFALLKMKNPFAPTIKWNKHQSPYFWGKMSQEFGFINPRIRWTTPGKLYRVFFGNSIASYFLISHFVLSLTKLWA